MSITRSWTARLVRNGMWRPLVWVLGQLRAGNATVAAWLAGTSVGGSLTGFASAHLTELIGSSPVGPWLSNPLLQLTSVASAAAGLVLVRFTKMTRLGVWVTAAALLGSTVGPLLVIAAPWIGAALLIAFMGESVARWTFRGNK